MKRKGKMSLLFKIVIAVVCVFLIVAAFRLQFDINELKDQKEKLELIEAQERYETERLREKNEKLSSGERTDEEYIKDTAKEKFGYTDSDDIVFYNSGDK